MGELTTHQFRCRLYGETIDDPDTIAAADRRAARYFGGIPFELVETRAEPADGRDSSLIHFIYLGITERQR